MGTFLRLIEIFARLRAPARSLCSNQPPMGPNSDSKELTLSLVLILELTGAKSHQENPVRPELNSFPGPCVASCICSYFCHWLVFSYHWIMLICPFQLYN